MEKPHYQEAPNERAIGSGHSAIASPLPPGPIDRAARAARGECVNNLLDGTLTISIDWLYDYSRLLIQQACEARLRSLGTMVGAGSTRQAVEDFMRAGSKG